MGRDVVRAAAVLVLVAAAIAGQRNAPTGSARVLADTAGTTSIQVPSESAGPLIEPPVISSRNGVLTADMKIVRAGAPGSGRPMLFGGLPTYSNPTPAPPSPQGNANPPHFPLNFAAGYQVSTPDGTVYPAQFPGPTLHIQPGDTIDLTMHDLLDAESTAPALPVGADLTNLHTHGLVVKPLADGDNVYRVMQQGGTYRTRVSVPSTQQPGMDWYHAHKHGFVADQVYGGLAGNIQIGSSLDPWPQFRGKYLERTLALTAGMITTDAKTGQRFPVDPKGTGSANPYGVTWRKYVNGQFNPTITVRPGETQVWSFTSMTRNGNFNLGLTDANGQNPWPATILSYDGDTSHVDPRAMPLALPVPYNYDGPTVLDDGARITMAVTAPKTPGTYYIVDNMLLRLTPNPTFFALATIKVEGTPSTEPAPVFPADGPPPDIFTATPDQRRTFDFSIDPSGPTTRFAINHTFFPDGPIVPIQVGQVEEWLLTNTSDVDHVFHIHQTDFAVISVNGNATRVGDPNSTSPYRYVSLRDSINIPPGGTVVIRFRVSPELGKFVIHCHILPHEDGGMMMALLAVPNATQRRIALNPAASGGSVVLVKDGNAQAVGHIALQSPTGPGVVTATGELTDDLVEDVVVGQPAGRGPASVSVYDGETLARIKQFIPFPQSPHAGVSVAVGDINRDGQGEIMVGRVGPGPSLVRIFRADGTPVRDITGTLPGSLPHGVTVTSADFNGDNYDDLAIGAGRGAEPRIVGYDGYSLSDLSAPTKLFAITAAGGGTSGVTLASAYYDPRSRPGLGANLITTPQTGPLAGTVQIWTPLGIAPGSSASGVHDHAETTPVRMATLRPLHRAVPAGLHLAVTRLGHQGLGALVAWTDPRHPVYVSIDDRGMVSRLQPGTGSRVVKLQSYQLPPPVAVVSSRVSDLNRFFCFLTALPH